MSIDKWPCIPDTFNSILPKDLPSFLQTGATHTLGRAVSIIDPKNETRIDAIEKFDGYQMFCKCLRAGCKNRNKEKNLDVFCSKFDLLMANYLLSHHSTTYEPITYRCYMGCEELATMIEIGGHNFMVVTGQFLPPEGLDDIKAAISCLGIKRPDRSEISSSLWESISKYSYPDHLWTSVMVTDQDRSHFLEHAKNLSPITEEFKTKFLLEAQRIAEIAQNYYNMAKAKIESEIMQKVAKVAFEIHINKSSDDLWTRINSVLDVFRQGLDLQYIVFLSGSKEKDSLLKVKSTVGTIPELDRNKEKGFLHFNWRKAGIMTNDERDTKEQIHECMDLGINNHEIMSHGFRGDQNPFLSASAIIPIRLANGPFGLLILGPHLSGVNLTDHETFILTSCRDLGMRILTQQLAEILRNDRADWEKTAKLTGHRVRASIQSINSQLRTIKSRQMNVQGFSDHDKEMAEIELDKAFTALTEVSYAAESSVPGTIDTKIARREIITLDEVISSAIEAQRDLADETGIIIDVSTEISKLPPIYANRTLMGYVFINIINNGLKYSYPRPDGGKRVLKITVPVERELGKAVICISNFGLGIKETDQTKIFEWGVRLVGAHFTFREIYGKGIGLWECKHIIEGHGGGSQVESEHYTGANVTDDNIEQCITKFTVILPAG